MALLASALLVGLSAGHAAPVFAAPSPPTVVSPTDGATGVATDAPLAVDVQSDSSGDATVEFYGREKGAGEPFTVVVMPDTQSYSDSETNYHYFTEQRDWILDQLEPLNIAAMAHPGDLVNFNNTTNWNRAMDALTPVERADLPLAITLGNHDYDSIQLDTAGGAAATAWDTRFPVASVDATKSLQRFGYAGGYMGDPTDAVTIDQDQGFPDRGWKNNYVLFSASGMDFVLVSAEFNFLPDEVTEWVDAVLEQYPQRRAILNTHQWLEDNTSASISTNGAADAWTTLKSSCNLFLIVSGHNHDTDGEVRRTEQNSCGDDVSMQMADYQSRANGGGGYLRTLTFDPAADSIATRTYSPSSDTYETDDDSQFTTSYDMDATPPVWESLGTATVAGGDGTASLTWTGLDNATEYEWYAEVTQDGQSQDNSAAPWSFTTVVAPDTVAPVISLEGPAELTVEVGSAFTDPGFTATDNVDGDVTGDVVVTGTVDTDTVGDYTLTYDVSDTAGNPAVQQTRVVHVVPVDAGWTAYVDTNSDTTGSTTSADALSLASATDSGTLKRFSDGSPITGVEVTGSITGDATKASNGANTDAGTDAASVFGGIVDLTGVYWFAEDDGTNLTFTGLNPSRTYTLATTSNRGNTDYTSRTTTFVLDDAIGFTNASSTGTTANAEGDEITFSTGNNTANGYVAKWTGVSPGSDGEIVLSSTFGTSDPAAYAAGGVMLELEPVGEDTVAPVITLDGPSEMTVEVGSAFTDPGYGAWDNVDGDITDDVEVTGTVDTDTVGDYTLTYDVSDTAGNPAVQKTRIVHVVPVETSWTAYVDTNSDTTGSTTSADALALTSATGSGTLKRFSDGSPITGVEVTGSTTGSVSKASNGADTADGTDADSVFGEMVDLAGVYTLTSGAMANLTFTGLSPGRTYTLVATSNRANEDYTSRTTTFVLDDADDFTNASSTGTAANAEGDEITFCTGHNTATGYVAKWTGISAGSDGEIVLSSTFGDSDPAAYAAGGVMLELEPAAADTTPPVITLDGDAEVTVEVGSSYAEPGYTATDNVDGDITDDVEVTGTVDTDTVGDYTLTYDVSDTAGNPAVQQTRIVHVVVVDTTAPVITLKGTPSMTLEVGRTYTEPGYTATDDVDGDITASVVVTGTVNTTKPGDYVLRYDVSDTAGNPAAQQTRTVRVVPAVQPVVKPLVLRDTSRLRIWLLASKQGAPVRVTSAKAGLATARLTVRPAAVGRKGTTPITIATGRKYLKAGVTGTLPVRFTPQGRNLQRKLGGKQVTLTVRVLDNTVRKSVRLVRPIVLGDTAALKVRRLASKVGAPLKVTSARVGLAKVRLMVRPAAVGRKGTRPIMIAAGRKYVKPGVTATLRVRLTPQGRNLRAKLRGKPVALTVTVLTSSVRRTFRLR